MPTPLRRREPRAAVFRTAARDVRLRRVPPAVAVPDLDATIAEALGAHRHDLERLVRERIDAALDAFVRELVDAEIAARSNGTASADAGADLGIRHVDEQNGPGTGIENARQTPPAKRCSGCRQVKPLAAFFKDRQTRDGYRRECKDCVSTRERQRRRRQREQQKANGPAPLASAGSTSPTSHEITPAASSD
jgi:hypothetical protein